ncbi:reverse transcriptase domain-containing protein [Tanacetum coccineum]
MPYSTYVKLTDERPAEIDIRLLLASHSYIYPLGIADDVLVKVVERVYPMDFVILNIMEDEKRPFILGTSFLTTAKVVIKFKKGTIVLRTWKKREILEWEERIKLHLEREIDFNRWKGKNFKGKHPTLVIVEGRLDDKGEVTMLLKRMSTSEAPAMTQAAIRKLVVDSVSVALEAQAVNMANTENTTRPREALVSRQCSYKEFMSCQPINFKGSEGAIGLIRWFERTESVFSHSNCTKDCKVKFATGTLNEEALSWWNSFAQPIRIEEAYKITCIEFKMLLIRESHIRRTPEVQYTYGGAQYAVTKEVPSLPESSIRRSALQGVRRTHSAFQRPGIIWKKRLQETMMEITLEESLSMFMAKIAKRQDENTNLIKELRASMDFALRNQKALIKGLEIQVKQMSIILHERLSGNLQSLIEIKPRVNDETISTSVKADKPSINVESCHN